MNSPLVGPEPRPRWGTKSKQKWNINIFFVARTKTNNFYSGRPLKGNLLSITSHWLENPLNGIPWLLKSHQINVKTYKAVLSASIGIEINISTYWLIIPQNTVGTFRLISITYRIESYIWFYYKSEIISEQIEPCQTVFVFNRF